MALSDADWCECMRMNDEFFAFMQSLERVFVAALIIPKKVICIILNNTSMESALQVEF